MVIAIWAATCAVAPAMWQDEARAAQQFELLPHRGASGSTILLMATEIISLDSSDEDEATTLAEKLAARAAVPAALQSSSKARGKRKAVIEEDSDDENSGQASPQRAVRRPRTAPPLGSAAAQKRTMVIEEDSDDEPLPVGGSSERAEAVAAAKEPTVAAAPAPSARKEPTAAAISAYQRSRASGVKARVFPLDKLPASNTISTGRTIKPISGWHGMWPPIREFFQNTIDHLDLRKEGGLHPALTRSVSRDAAGRTRIAFRCGGELVCLVVCSADQLLIAQAHTFPLHPRALDTGVDDTSKGGDATAGGFGDGFKTGIVALLALPHSACRAIRWDMLGGGRHVSWQFVGARRDAVGTFAKSTVLEVHATNQAVSPGAASAGAASGGGGGFAPDIEAVAVVRGPGGFGSLDNIMVQTYDVKGIGTAFL